MTYEELMEKYQNMQKEYNTLKIKYENAELQLNSLKRMIFGSKREATPKDLQLENGMQCSFFDDEKSIEEDLQNQIKEETEKITVYRKKNKKEKKAGIKRSYLNQIVTESKEYVLNEDDTCLHCAGELKVVGKKVVRQEIEYVPAKLKLINYVQYTYKCKKCGSKESEKETPSFFCQAVPKPLLTHSFASPSLATEVIYQKYYMGVPLYRQEKVWDDRGLVLPRNMMSNWCIKIVQYYLENLYKLMLKTLKKECTILHCDETTMQCNKEDGRNASNKSYMWVMVSGKDEKHKACIFHYSPSRAAKVAEELFKGYNGVLVTDGYAGYDNLELQAHAECWAHCRRYFYESIPLNANKEMDTTSAGYQGVLLCDELFKIEREISELSDEEKLKIRQEKSKPVLEKFFNWVNLTSQKIIVNEKLNKALTYATNQQKELSQFLNNAKIPLTNSLAERAIRPFAVHRKNWLFADSVDGAKANAVFYSIIESAKLNNLNIEQYILYLLQELPQLENIYDKTALAKYLPWSKDLPDNLLNFQGTYKDLSLGE